MRTGRRASVRRAPTASVLALAAIVIGCGSSATVDTGRPPDPMVDGYAVGSGREAINGDLFHRLEVATRNAWRNSHQTNPSSFVLHHAGTLADGSVQAGTDELFTYLMVFDVPGHGPHAVVLRCSPFAAIGWGDCE